MVPDFFYQTEKLRAMIVALLALGADAYRIAFERARDALASPVVAGAHTAYYEYGEEIFTNTILRTEGCNFLQVKHSTLAFLQSAGSHAKDVKDILQYMLDQKSEREEANMSKHREKLARDAQNGGDLANVRIVQLMFQIDS